MVTDKSNMVALLDSFPKQINESLTLPQGITGRRDINRIVVGGMGGSAVSGDILKIFMEKSNLPVIVVRDYDLPSIVDENSLVFLISYSGNTEETLSLLEQAKKRNCSIIGITSGGKLAEQVDKVIKIPSGLPPRYALGYLFFTLIGVLSNSDLITIRNEEINELLSILASKRESFKEKAKELASKLDGKLPIIYSSPRFEPIAYRFKTQINENSKSPAYNNTIPELNHNEIVGYQTMDRRQYLTIFIEDSEDHERIKKRIKISKDIMKRTVDIVSIKTVGTSLFSRVFATIYFLDYVSYFLALRKRTDPYPVEMIDELKERMSK
ncbi:bifunctional phosphoglucose/phosphomannose isomerase [Nanoarchaeota archaeon]